MNGEQKETKTADRQASTSTDWLGDKAYYILVTIDLTEQKAVGVKFCKDQQQLTAFQKMFTDDFGDGYVTFAHAYYAANAKITGKN